MSPISTVRGGGLRQEYLWRRDGSPSTSSSASAEASEASATVKVPSRKIKQIKLNLLRLLLITGCHSCLLVVPPMWRVHKFVAAGNFNSFLEMYAAALAA